ncbi:MAG TPA: hypothetical protein PLB97_01925, partial [Accumulibacter sp.]|nr:hypothetical protein [Accumulibacter sp.]
IYRRKRLGDSLYFRTVERRVTAANFAVALIYTFLLACSNLSGQGELRLPHDQGCEKRGLRRKIAKNLAKPCRAGVCLERLIADATHRNSGMKRTD